MSSLLNKLLTNVLSQEGTEALASKSNTDSTQIQSIVQAALPVLMQSMVNKAGDDQSAAGLTKALGSHAATEGTIAEQIAGADTEDGAKILSHLMGDKSDSVIDKLSSSMNVSSSQVGTILSSLAPVLLSMVGKETKSKEADAGGLGGILSGLLGGKSDSDDSAGASDLLGNLLGMATGGGDDKKTSDSDGQDNDILSSLLGLISGK